MSALRALAACLACFGTASCSEAAPTAAGVPEAQDIAGGTMVTDLPHARGKSFASLDAYLAYLKEVGTMDIPFYERRDDGRYVYIRGRIRPGPDDVYTREQLMERYGFER